MNFEWPWNDSAIGVDLYNQTLTGGGVEDFEQCSLRLRPRSVCACSQRSRRGGDERQL